MPDQDWSLPPVQIAIVSIAAMPPLAKTGHYAPLSDARAIGVTFNHELPAGRAEVRRI
jgi:hypothetical protein